MQKRILALALLSALALAAPNAPIAFAQSTSAREIAGLSRERLQKLVSVFRSDVDEGRIPGVVVLVARNGEVALFEAIGFRDRAAGAGAGAKMEKDAIFRLYSMTKPIVSVAVMMLFEDGRLLLTDPVSKHMPELKGLKVGIEKPGPELNPLDASRPAARWWRSSRSCRSRSNPAPPGTTGNRPICSASSSNASRGSPSTCSSRSAS
jgi:CubicO group peptidase (beta-lactamase class C family)